MASSQLLGSTTMVGGGAEGQASLMDWSREHSSCTRWMDLLSMRRAMNMLNTFGVILLKKLGKRGHVDLNYGSRATLSNIRGVDEHAREKPQMF